MFYIIDKTARLFVGTEPYYVFFGLKSVCLPLFAHAHRAIAKGIDVIEEEKRTNLATQI